MSSVSKELDKSKKEIDRLASNWKALLDIMPEMVALIGEDYVVQYMNPVAISAFGDCCGKLCSKSLCNSDDRCKTYCPVDFALSGKRQTGLDETRIGDVDVEYSYIPFQGYKGDKLVLMVMRDVTERKLQEQELKNFHNNIEEVLQCKIKELKESESVRNNLSREVNLLQKRLEHKEQTDEMIGSSRKMAILRDTIDQVADSDATILITGESGTGKELVANLLRARSHRRNKTFLKVNCNSINDNLLESDLFGYEKGSFTGASARKKGKFEIVDGGTIFLDEIGDISPRMQASLLRVLQNGEVMRVGGTEPIHVDVRIITATNVDLAKAVQDGRFRLDLYYRLNIINIFIPPLRERKEDIVDLAIHFVKHYRQAFKKEIDFLPEALINKLLMHDWPGNIRELENVIQRAVLMARNSMITEQDMVFDANPTPDNKSNYLNSVYDRIGRNSLKEILAEFERDIILNCLEKNEGNVQQAAFDLRVGKTGLYDKMKRYKLTPKLLKDR